MQTITMATSVLDRRRALRADERQLDSQLNTRYDLTITQLEVMLSIEHESKPMGTIAQELDTNTGNVTNVTDRLEGKGLVTRVLNREDRRSINLELTPAGADLLARIRSETDPQEG